MPLRTPDRGSELRYANQGNLRNRAFAVSFWLYHDTNSGSTNPSYLLNLKSPTAGTYGVTIRIRNDASFEQAVEFNKSLSGSNAVHNSTAVSAAAAVPIRKWTHIICTCNGLTTSANMRIKVNGNTYSSGASVGSDAIDYNGVISVMGRDTGTLGLWGMVHKFVMIVDREFTAGEETELAAGRLPTTLDHSHADYTDDGYLRLDYDTLTTGIDNGGAVEAISGTAGTPALTARYPADIPGCAAFYDGNDATNLHSTGTTDVVEGDTIDNALDKSGAGNTISQATADNRPGWSTNYDASGRIIGPRFDTTAGPPGRVLRHLAGAGTSLWNNQACTMIRVGGGPLRCQSGEEFTLCHLNAGAAELRTSDGFISIKKENGGQQIRQFAISANSAPDVIGVASGTANVIGFRGNVMETIATPLTAVTAAAGLEIGRGFGGTLANSEQGEVSLWAFYQRQFDAQNITDFNTWASTQYGFQDRTRLLFAVGSSTIYGTSFETGSHGWDRRLSTAFLNKTLLINAGQGGSVASAIIATFPEFIDPIVADVEAQGLPAGTVGIVLLGINFSNDFADLGSEDEAAITARLIAKYDEAAAYMRALGLKIIAVIPIRGDAAQLHVPSYEAYMVHLNGPADKDAIIDLFQNEPTNDGLHFDEVGHATFAALVEAAVAEVEAPSGGGNARTSSRLTGRLSRLNRLS